MTSYAPETGLAHNNRWFGWFERGDSESEPAILTTFHGTDPFQGKSCKTLPLQTLLLIA